MELRGWLLTGALFAALIVGVFAGITLTDRPAAIFGSGPITVTMWLYQWSTLITGVLALLAAGFTLAGAFSVDLRAQVRHEQLVQLQLRKDALAVDRAAFPLAVNLRVDAERVLKTIEQLPMMGSDTGSLCALVAKTVWLGDMVAGDRKLDAAKLLLGGFEHLILDGLEEATIALREFDRNSLRIDDGFGNRSVSYSCNNAHWIAMRDTTVGLVESTVGYAQEFADCLTDLYAIYEPGLAELKNRKSRDRGIRD